MIKHFCDGCGAPLDRPSATVIRGERANGMGGGGLPDGEFEWCLSCAKTAFNAVRERHARQSGIVT
jgi:hypothetical protein